MRWGEGQGEGFVPLHTYGLNLSLLFPSPSVIHTFRPMVNEWLFWNVRCSERTAGQAIYFRRQHRERLPEFLDFGVFLAFERGQPGLLFAFGFGLLGPQLPQRFNHQRLEAANGDAFVTAGAGLEALVVEA